LAVVGLTTPNPTIVGAERLVCRPDSPDSAGHAEPVPVGPRVGALVHVIATGDTAAILMFGSVAMLGLAGTRVLNERKGRNSRFNGLASRLARSEGGDSCSPLCSWAPRRRAPRGHPCSPVADPRNSLKSVRQGREQWLRRRTSRSCARYSVRSRTATWLDWSP